MPVRWTAFQNLHLTVQFIGDVDEKRIPDMKQILNRIRKPEQCEVLKFTGISAFPAGGSPRIIYFGINSSDYLRKIHRLVTNDLIRNGFPADNKPFKAHLTLARVRDGNTVTEPQMAHLKELASTLTVEDSPLDRIILFESQLRPGGPVYTSLYEKKLV